MKYVKEIDFVSGNYFSVPSDKPLSRFHALRGNALLCRQEFYPDGIPLIVKYF